MVATALAEMGPEEVAAKVAATAAAMAVAMVAAVMVAAVMAAAAMVAAVTAAVEMAESGDGGGGMMHVQWVLGHVPGCCASSWQYASYDDGRGGRDRGVETAVGAMGQPAPQPLPLEVAAMAAAAMEGAAMAVTAMVAAVLVAVARVAAAMEAAAMAAVAMAEEATVAVRAVEVTAEVEAAASRLLHSAMLGTSILLALCNTVEPAGCSTPSYSSFRRCTCWRRAGSTTSPAPLARQFGR